MLDDAAVSEYIADEEEAARVALAKFMDDIGETSAKAVLRIDQTQASYTILDAAAYSKCDLLVIGVRSRTGLAKLLLGSTAEGILASAKIDVLAIPPIN